MGESELIQPSFPYNAVIDLSQQCKICDRGGEEDQVGFGALILYSLPLLIHQMH